LGLWLLVSDLVFRVLDSGLQAPGLRFWVPVTLFWALHCFLWFRVFIFHVLDTSGCILGYGQRVLGSGLQVLYSGFQ